MDHILDFGSQSISASNSNAESTPDMLLCDEDADLADLLQLDGNCSTGSPANDPVLAFATVNSPHLCGSPASFQTFPDALWPVNVESGKSAESNFGIVDNSSESSVEESRSFLPIPSHPLLFPSSSSNSLGASSLSALETPISFFVPRRESRQTFNQAIKPERLTFRSCVRPPAKCSDVGFQDPIPREGQLQLTEEERRTLISEGLVLPQRLPLTADEEQTLKRVRRKIKNKISAQDSRRRRKEYIEALEMNLQIANRRTAELQMCVRKLEDANIRLTLQLHRNNARRSNRLAPSITPSASFGGSHPLPTVSSTCLKLLVLCCAIFLVHENNSVDRIPSASRKVIGLMPKLPWVQTVAVIPAWRWSPVRHFSKLHNTDGSGNGGETLEVGPLVLSIADGRSRLIVDDDEVKEFGPDPFPIPLFDNRSAAQIHSTSDFAVYVRPFVPSLRNSQNMSTNHNPLSVKLRGVCYL